MLCGCIDIGTNTTRVLVADARDGRLHEVLQRRAFTRLGRGLTAGGRIPEARIAENAGVVAEQLALAEQAGARTVRTVATAVIRSAVNRDEFCKAMREHGGVDVCVLDGEEEARLAFLGATRTLGRPLHGRVAVVDVGGGSTEIAIGTVDGRSRLVALVRVRLGLSRRRLPGRRPADRGRARRGPLPRRAGAQGRRSAADRRGGRGRRERRLAAPAGRRRARSPQPRARPGGPHQWSCADVARRFELDPQRVRLMPAGLLALEAAGLVLGQPLQIARGGLREGVLLDLAGA